MQQQRFSSLSMFVSENCNLRCKYCFIDEYNAKDSNKQTLKDNIDWFLDDKISSPNVHIHIFGTEPLYRWDLSKFIVDYLRNECKDRKKQISIGMTTNGVNLTENVADYLKDNTVRLLCSIDGMKSNHDKYRVFPDGSGSWDIVSKNFEYWVRHCDPAAEAAMTITHDVCKNLLPNLLAIYKIGFNSVALNKYSDGPLPPFTSDDLNELEKSVDYVIKHTVSSAQAGVYYYIMFLTNAIVQRYRGERNKNIKATCGAAKGSIAVDIYGNIFICHRAIYYDMFKLGNVYDGIDWNKVEWWRKQEHKFCHYCKMPSCSPCYIINLNRFGDPWAVPWDYCRYNQIINQKSLELEVALKNNNVYDEYIKGCTSRYQYALNSAQSLRRWGKNK